MADDVDDDDCTTTAAAASDGRDDFVRAGEKADGTKASTDADAIMATMAMAAYWIFMVERSSLSNSYYGLISFLFIFMIAGGWGRNEKCMN